jgi:hypothetical protein
LPMLGDKWRHFGYRVSMETNMDRHKYKLPI